MTRALVIVVLTCAAVACAGPAAAGAATPFTAGLGVGHDLAVGSDGSGHVVWLTEETGDRVRYCRVPPGGAACAASKLLSFPNGAAADGGDSAQVFTPAPNKVVIIASCFECFADPASTNRTFRWVSTDNGATFSAFPTQMGAGFGSSGLLLNGQAAYLDSANLLFGVEGAHFLGMNATAPPEANPIQLAPGFLFVYSPAVVWNSTLSTAPRAVHAVNDLDTVKYAVYTDTDEMPTVTELNNITNWDHNQLLSGAEGDNSETHLSTGSHGIFLSYQHFVPLDDRIGLRKFNPATNTFGAPTYVEGPDPIENRPIHEPHHSQDAAGRLHVVWRSLYGTGRLRYRRSDDGVTFTPAANLASSEDFIDPIVEAGPSGTGFAVWSNAGTSQIRVVRIDPQPEPAPPPTPPPAPPPVSAPDTSAPAVSGLGIGDSTLTPGQRTTIAFTTTEGGLAVLTIKKRVPGLKTRRRGRRVCVPRTKKRLRALRRSAGSRRAFRRLLRKRRCKAHKKIGAIRQQVGPGRNEVVFTGRIAGRRLRPGHYRAVLVITDAAGNVSRREIVRFRVIRRR